MALREVVYINDEEDDQEAEEILVQEVKDQNPFVYEQKASDQPQGATFLLP